MVLMESFSGIRGIYGKDLTEETAIRYVHSFSEFIKKKAKKNNATVVIGMDTRPSGLILKNSIKEIVDCNFIDVGIATTPAIEFAVRHFNADGGVIITASHNEPYWNGFKFLGSDGAVLSEKEMNEVIKNSKFLKNFHKVQERKITEKNEEAIEEYKNFILKIIGKKNIESIKKSKQRLLIDPNGGSGVIAKAILESVGVEVIALNMEIGQFNRTIEPTEDALVYLKSAIEKNNADFAAAFDCDADRVEIMLSSGKLLSGNYILALVVQEALSNADKNKKHTIVINDATSNAVRDIAQKFNAKIKEVEVGESNVVHEMDNSKALVGGEGSSGGSITPPSKCRDGILALLQVLSIVAKQNKKLDGIIDALPKYYNLKKKVEFDLKNHDKIKKSLKIYYSKKSLETKEITGIKGSLKVITGKNSFIWFRASKTESGVFRIIADSDDKKESENLMEEAVKVFDDANKQ
ncbi:MAG: hypothetical protein AABX00_00795 [Nanoarchaeota archaeon]